MNGKTDPRFQIDVGSYTDPVCKMAVEREKARAIEWDGQIYYFCSLGCRNEFANDAEKFLADKESSPL